jgi:hypothetical protein
LTDVELSTKELSRLQKLLRLFLLGQITGLPSLHSILTRFGISSNNEQINYTNLCNKLSNSNLHKMYEYVFEQHIADTLSEFSDKHASKWSRDLVTAVLDDSVFKQWLQASDAKKDFDNCYGRFFSGQVGHVVYGFQIVTFGLVIEEVFYPLYFEAVKKEATKYNEKGKKIARKGKATVDVAQNLIKKWAAFVKKMKKDGIIIPNIYFSCDSGYSDVSLSNICLDAGLIYISVPKMSHKIDYNGTETNLKDWVENIFIVLENEHKIAPKGLKNGDKIPFCYRFRAIYQCQNREVTWLAFRLNGSKKVTLIYTTDKNIKGVTLRRHWFNRTYIEQFFKLLKHYMIIQNSITVDKHQFECKLLRFAFVGLHIQLLVKQMKKKIPECREKGFGFIRMLMQSDKKTLDLLHQILNTKY